MILGDYEVGLGDNKYTPHSTLPNTITDIFNNSWLHDHIISNIVGQDDWVYTQFEFKIRYGNTGNNPNFGCIYRANSDRVFYSLTFDLVDNKLKIIKTYQQAELVLAEIPIPVQVVKDEWVHIKATLTSNRVSFYILDYVGATPNEVPDIEMIDSSSLKGAIGFFSLRSNINVKDVYIYDYSF